LGAGVGLKKEIAVRTTLTVGSWRRRSPNLLVLLTSQVVMSCSHKPEKNSPIVSYYITLATVVSLVLHVL
jgi:hypothetical protein